MLLCYVGLGVGVRGALTSSCEPHLGHRFCKTFRVDKHESVHRDSISSFRIRIS
jgi:hypothetical protein